MPNNTTQVVTRPEQMLPIMIVLGIMFIGICIAMNLFSRARFKKRRNVFAVANRAPAQKRSGRGSGPGSSRRLSSYCPSPMPPMGSTISGNAGATATTTTTTSNINDFNQFQSNIGGSGRVSVARISCCSWCACANTIAPCWCNHRSLHVRETLCALMRHLRYILMYQSGKIIDYITIGRFQDVELQAFSINERSPRYYQDAMKFVIRSLLFVNLLLQMTNSLRQCFNHDQNIMITIILLAFSVIALIGLVIGNRFILIIFSASMTLILIASITIYAIGKTEEDALRPKVPYYTNRVYDRGTADPLDTKRNRLEDDSAGKHKFKSLVDKWLPSSKNNKEDAPRAKIRARYNKTRSNMIKQQQQQQLARLRANQRGPDQLLIGPATTIISPTLLDDLSDEPTNALQMQDILHTPNGYLDARSQLVLAKDISSAGEQSKIVSQKANSLQTSVNRNQFNTVKEDPEAESDSRDGEQVISEQWIAYERYLYERYLNIVSQSIDLVMHTILAAWMALLLDEDSDHCFGSKHSVMKSVASMGQGAKAPPVYNYNGVRYSIRPDVDDSLARVVVS